MSESSPKRGQKRESGRVEDAAEKARRSIEGESERDARARRELQELERAEREQRARETLRRLRRDFEQ